MPDLPEPHSPEWFARMMKVNPAQAKQTELLIQRTGTPNCCCICGDTKDVHDYKTVAEPILTCRMCDDCVSNQKAQYGLSLDPIHRE